MSAMRVYETVAIAFLSLASGCEPTREGRACARPSPSVPARRAGSPQRSDAQSMETWAEKLFFLAVGTDLESAFEQSMPRFLSLPPSL